MSDLWAFGRRPSCMVRYRHGGYSAIYPRGNPILFDLEEAEAALQAEGGNTAETLVERPHEAPKNDNVLSFPTGRARKPRQSPNRAKSRPNPPSSPLKSAD